MTLFKDGATYIELSDYQKVCDERDQLTNALNLVLLSVPIYSESWHAANNALNNKDVK